MIITIRRLLTMQSKFGRRTFSILLGVLAIGLIAGLAISAFVAQPATSVNAAQGSSNTNALSAGSDTSNAADLFTTGNDLSSVSDVVTGTATSKNANAQAFKQAFAQALGVDESKLDSAYATAVGTVVDQAVKDGKLTQAQADKIKAQAKNGFQGGFGFFGRGFGGPGPVNGAKPAMPMMGAFGNYIQTVFDTAASTIGITSAQLKTEMQGGKSIAQVAQAHNVDLAKVKSAVLAAVKTNLDQAVKDSKLTQAQADKVNQMVTDNIDKFLSNTGGAFGGHRGNFGPGAKGGKAPNSTSTPTSGSTNNG
jgi:hypothetical protein